MKNNTSRAKKFLNVAFEIKEDSIKEDGTFEGYASTFDGDPDSYGDVVLPGAFKNSIKRGGRNRTGIPMLWQHNSETPIGKWLQLSEDDKGLNTIGKLTRGVSKAEDAYFLLKDRAIQHYSIGYDYERGQDGKPDKEAYTFDKDSGIRYLKKLELWEISLVTFPANINATIVGVKDIENATTPRELEEVLREAGLTKEAAMLIVKLARPSLREAETKTGKVDVNRLAGILADLRGIRIAAKLASKIRNS